MIFNNMKNKKRTLFVCILAVAMTICVALICVNQNYVIKSGTYGDGGNASINFSNAGVKNSYVLGDVFDVPDATIEYNGKQYDAQRTIVIFPRGNATTKKTIVLEQIGQYKINYQAVVNGKQISAEKTFIVNEQLYSFSGEKSSASYGSHPVYATEKKGIVTKIARGETMFFNKAIDLKEFKSRDPQMSFFATPSSVGIPDATAVTVRFTDAYDSTNYVNVELRDVSFVQGDWAIHHTYTVAASSMQPFSGIEGGKVHVNDVYGHPCEFSLAGVPKNGGKPGSEDFSLLFNYAKLQISDKAGMIIDLDDSSHFTSLWGGFKTGECFISVYGNMYQSTHLNLTFNKFFDLDLTQTIFNDERTPTITVETDKYSLANLPHACVSLPYNVFSASAYDVQDGAREVKKYVYYNYGTPNCVNINVSDNKFIPTKSGVYTIVYQASDKAGNLAKKELSVRCLDNTPLDITVTNPIKIVCKAGQKYTICDDISATNMSGNAKITISAKLNGSDKIYKIDNETLEFMPLEQGVYTIEISCADYIQKAVKTFEISVDASDIPVYLTEPICEKYMIRGVQYALAKHSGFDFTSGVAKEIPAKITVSEDGNAEMEVSDMYQVCAERSVNIIYTITSSSGKTAKITKTVPIIDVGYGASVKLVEYFLVTQGDMKRQQTPLDIEFTTKTSNSAAEFINPLMAENFSMSFGSNGEKNNFERLNIYLTDSENSAQEILISYINVGGGAAVVSVNNGLNYNLTANFNGIGENFQANYNNKTRIFSASSKLNIPIKESLSGEKFEGFTSEKLRMRFEFKNVKGLSAIRLLSINNTSFADFDSDNFPPTIAYTAIRGNRMLGDIIDLLPAHAMDVLDPTVKLTLTVMDAKGNYVKSNKGVVLDKTCNPSDAHSFTMTEYGDYSVLYEASDSSGITITESYGVSVADMIKPKLELTNIVSSAKRNENVTIANATATDDCTVNLKINTYLITPSAEIYSLENNKFKAVESGVYTVMYTVYDDNNNFTMAKYFVTVN